MFLELCPHRDGRADGHFVQVRHVGGRLGRGRVEQVVENPLAAQHRRGARGVRRDGQHAALREHAGTRQPRQLHPAQLGPRHVGNPVMPRQALVDEGILPVDEVQNAAVFANHVGDERLGLAPHREPQIVFEIREALPVARDRLQRPELQPLPAEVLGQRP